MKHLKLLRPDDTLLLGRVYRLVSFEGTSRLPPPSSRRPLRSLALRRRAEMFPGVNLLRVYVRTCLRLRRAIPASRRPIKCRFLTTRAAD